MNEIIIEENKNIIIESSERKHKTPCNVILLRSSVSSVHVLYKECHESLSYVFTDPALVMLELLGIWASSFSDS